MSTRELYADRDEALFQLRRPIISMASKNLLLEATCLIVPSFSTYRASPPNVAKQNGSSGVNSSSHTQESWERWCPLFPLQSGPTSTSRFHRYREWLISCDGLSQRNRPGPEARRFLVSLRRQSRFSKPTALEASPLTQPLLEMLKMPRRERSPIELKAAQLLDRLKLFLPDAAKPPRGWPHSPTAFGGALRRIAPNLRKLGIKVTFRKRAASALSRSRTSVDYKPRMSRICLRPAANCKRTYA